jgi:hypothetical protein
VKRESKALNSKRYAKLYFSFFVNALSGGYDGSRSSPCSGIKMAV